MASTVFSVSSSYELTAQPAGAGEKFIIRSTSAADTGNATVTGLVAATSTSETNALTGKREKQTTAAFTSLTQLKLSAAQAGIVSVYGQGTKGTGDLRVDTLPANNDTLRIGLTGFQQTYTFKTTLTGAANEIKIAASVALQATNIYEAINAGANAGTDYGTGTAANSYVTASAPSAAVLVITDKLACARLLTWAIDQGTGATISIRTIVGGVQGNLLATAPVAITAVLDSFSLSSEDLVATPLRALHTPTTDAVTVGGGLCTLRFKCANVVTAITAKYQTSTDGTNWSDGALGSFSIDNYTVTDPLYVIPSEGNISQIRLVFTANANTTDSALDAQVIY